jgi:hypothetical protein
MSHPQVGCAWLVHSSEEEFPHHLRPPRFRIAGRCFSAPEGANLHPPAAEQSRKQVVATAHKGLTNHPDPSTFVSPPVKPSDTEVPSDPTGLKTIND